MNTFWFHPCVRILEVCVRVHHVCVRMVVHKKHVHACFQYVHAHLWYASIVVLVDTILCPKHAISLFFCLFLSNMIHRLVFLSFTSLWSYSSKGNSKSLFDWHFLGLQPLTAETRALMEAAGFEPLMHLFLESTASGVLVHALAERWWDTTHTFYIAKWEMTVTPHDFHRMIDLRSHRPIINLEGEWS